MDVSGPYDAQHEVCLLPSLLSLGLILAPQDCKKPGGNEVSKTPLDVKCTTGLRL